MTKDNVVVLENGFIPRPEGQPDPRIVEMLEKWLNDAKSGRLAAVAICGVTIPTDRASSWSAEANYENHLAASIMSMFNRFSVWLNTGTL